MPLKRPNFKPAAKIQTSGGGDAGTREADNSPIPEKRYITELAEVMASDRAEVEAFLKANPDHLDMPLWLVLNHLNKQQTTRAPKLDPEPAVKTAGGLRDPLGGGRQ